MKYPRLLTGFGMLVLFTNLIANRLLSNRQLQMVLDGKSSQEYPVDAGVHRGFILGPTFFLQYLNDLHDDVTCTITI